MKMPREVAILSSKSGREGALWPENLRSLHVDPQAAPERNYSPGFLALHGVMLLHFPDGHRVMTYFFQNSVVVE